MPAKTMQAKPKTPKAPTVVEMQRRRDQSKRDKRTVGTPPKGGLLRKVVTARAKQGVDNGPFTLLAKSIVAPRDVPPMRLPTPIARYTDTKHLWNTFELAPILLSTPVNAATPKLFGAHLVAGQNRVIMFRNPVCPVGYFAPFVPRAGTAPTIYEWQLEGFDGQPNSSVNYLVLTPELDGVRVAASPAAPVTISPPAEKRIIAPTVQRSTTPIAGMGVVPAMVDKFGNNWHLYRGGALSVTIESVAATGVGLPNTGIPIPAGGGAGVRVVLQRYNGTRDPDELLTANISIDAGNISATLFLNAAGVADTSLVDSVTRIKYGTFEPNVGYYRFAVMDIRFEAPTAAFTYNIIASASNVFGAAAASVPNVGAPPSYIWLTPVNSVTTEAPYMLENCRVNASSALLTNTTAKMFRGGTATGCKLGSRSTGGDWYSINQDAVDSAVGHPTHGYRGELEKGCYTWMEIPDDYFDFQPSLQSLSKLAATSTVTAVTGLPMTPIVPIDYSWGVHALLFTAPIDANPSVSQPATFLLRVDQHLEFHTNSQFATLKATPLDVDAMRLASLTLVAAPLFTENWIHLNEIWSKIVGAGKTVLAAGGKAMVGAAMKELVAAAAVLAL